MRRVAAVALALAAAGCASGGNPHPFRVISRVDTEYVEHYRLVWTDSRQARSVQLGTYVRRRLVAPDGRTVVFGGSPLQFVDLVHRTKAWSVQIGGKYEGCDSEPLLWGRKDRVTLTVWCGSVHLTSRSDLLVADPLQRRFVGRRPIGIVMGGPTRTRLGTSVLLTSPPLVGRFHEEQSGPARLIVVRPSGKANVIVLPVEAGMANGRRFNRSPGFVLDETRTHAYVIGERQGAARIDLRTLNVTWHRLRHAFDAQPALHDLPHPHQGTTNPSRDLDREAVWLGRGLIAVTGSDTWSPHGYDRSAPAGLKLLDVRRWSVRLLQARVASVVLAGRRLVATGPRAGLTEYDRAGKRLFHTLDGKTLFVSAVRGNVIYVSDGRNNDVVRLR